MLPPPPPPTVSNVENGALIATISVVKVEVVVEPVAPSGKSESGSSAHPRRKQTPPFARLPSLVLFLSYDHLPLIPFHHPTTTISTIITTTAKPPFT